MADATVTVHVDGLPAVRALIADLAAERDRARDTAVRLEQDGAHLVDLACSLRDDLERMDREQAIELDGWPAALALVNWLAS